MTDAKSPKKKREIAAHKGGRTERLYVRATPAVKAYLESQQETIADWIERKVQEDKQSKN